MVPQPQVPEEGRDPAQEQEQSPSEYPPPYQGPGGHGRVRHRPHPHHGQGHGQSGEGTRHHPRDLNPMPVSEFQDQQTVVCPRPPHPTPVGRLRPLKKPKAEGQQEPTGPPSNRHFLDCAQGSLEHVRKVGQPHPQLTPRSLTGGQSRVGMEGRNHPSASGDGLGLEETRRQVLCKKGPRHQGGQKPAVDVHAANLVPLQLRNPSPTKGLGPLTNRRKSRSWHPHTEGPWP